MLYGATIGQADRAMPVADLAQALEERGFDSLFLPEHTHTPAAQRTEYPGGHRERDEWSSYDPFVALAMAAAATTRLKIGTSICLVVQHDPITLAKTVASLDHLSGGRFLFGVGAGWNREEMANHGTAFESRFRLMKERLLAMKEIWNHDEAEYHGEFVDFDPVWSYPKPVQLPNPPILMAGENKYVLRRVVDYCDGWFPRSRPGVDVILSGLAELRAMAAEAGRDPGTITTTLYAANPDPKELERLAAAGVNRVVFLLPARDRDLLLPLLDRYATLMR
jgi:probable F420-dependent oxidoreductase